MITLVEYFGPWKGHVDATEERISNALRLLEACSGLETEMVKAGVVFPINPATKSGVSGKHFGGFRPQDCPQGAPKSSHKDGLGVDRWDPLEEIDDWLMKNPSALERHGIYIEHPDDTKGWSHWSIKPPRSGRHVFKP